MMNGKEKLYFLLIVIEDVKTITPFNQPLIIDPLSNLNDKFRDIELMQLFAMLETDEQVLRVLKAPSRIRTVLDNYDPYEYADDDCWHITLLTAFDKYFLQIQQEPEYQEFTGKRLIRPIVHAKTNLSRKALEKIWTVLQEIEDKRGITPAQDDFSIPLVHFSKVKDEVGATNASDERRNILIKLENEENAIQDVRFPDNLREYVYLKIGSRYFEVFDNYKKEYEKTAKDYQQSQQPQEISVENSAYEVKYSDKARKILVNNFLLKQPRSFGDNEAIFAYLYNNPNQNKSIEDIKKGTGLDLIKDLNKFVENIGFTGDFRKVFFKVSKNIIRFNNPITKEDLKELGIEYLKLE